MGTKAKEKTMTLAEQYRAQLKQQPAQAEAVDVTLPSGFVIRMEKPSPFDMLFDLGDLPTSAIIPALEEWKRAGVVGDDKAAAAVAENMSAADQAKVVEKMLRVRNRVLQLSIEPKLVVGLADEAKGEMSVFELSDIDKAFLFNWVMKGGEIPKGVVMFPGRSQPDAVAGSNRKERRTAAKRTRGAHG